MNTDSVVPDWLKGIPLRPVVLALSTKSPALTICARCPDALWYVESKDPNTPQEFAFCRAMSVLVWEPGAQNRLLDCDHLRQLVERMNAKTKKKEQAEAKRKAKAHAATATAVADPLPPQVPPAPVSPAVRN